MCWPVTEDRTPAPSGICNWELPDGRELLGAERQAHGSAGDAVAGCWALHEPLPLHMGSEQTSQVVPNSLDWDPISLQVQTLILWSASPCLAMLQAPQLLPQVMLLEGWAQRGLLSQGHSAPP